MWEWGWGRRGGDISFFFFFFFLSFGKQTSSWLKLRIVVSSLGGNIFSFLIFYQLFDFKGRNRLVDIIPLQCEKITQVIIQIWYR